MSWTVDNLLFWKMPGWKNALLLGLAALAGIRPALSHAHHDESDVVPEDKREELLQKWEQEVSKVMLCDDVA